MARLAGTSDASSTVMPISTLTAPNTLRSNGLMTAGLPGWVTGSRPQPGVCRAFEEAAGTWPEIRGNRGLVEQIWNENEGLANLFIWHVLLSDVPVERWWG
ncbi:MAG: hypothetical protein SGI92_20520 [Bryobacteraceae bacterium]|nr:hypothetical protein [Bryobacteraceae bacterium]